VRAAIIVVSSSKAAGQGEDEGGPALAAWVSGLGIEPAATEVIADDRELISARLRHWADDEACELIVTTGGTGLTPNDLTPEATEDVIERRVPGLAEAIRAASREHTPNWMLSRGVAGTRGGSLIVNFPGNPKAIGETAAALSDAIGHGLALLRGRHSPHR
jgi:molybdenum cofactor synthesis domain-containing protein